MESFDTNGGVYSTLKTDIVTIELFDKVIEILEPPSEILTWDDAYLPPIVWSLTMDPPEAITPTSLPITGYYNEQQKVILSFANPLVLQNELTNHFGTSSMEGLQIRMEDNDLPSFVTLGKVDTSFEKGFGTVELTL